MSAEFHDLLTEAFPEMRPPRRNLRFLSDTGSPSVRMVDSDGHEVVGILENESYSGFAAIIAGEHGLKTNTDVSVDYYGYPMQGTIRRVQRQADGTYMVGIEWK